MEEDFDPKSIEDEGLRQVVLYLMNQVENLSAQVVQLTAENQQLCDEIKRLKGEQGKPKIAANKPRQDLSWEKERRQSKPHHKSGSRRLWRLLPTEPRQPIPWSTCYCATTLPNSMHSPLGSRCAGSMNFAITRNCCPALRTIVCSCKTLARPSGSCIKVSWTT